MDIYAISAHYGTLLCVQEALSNTEDGPPGAILDYIPRTIPQEGGPIPLHRDTTIYMPSLLGVQEALSNTEDGPPGAIT